MNPTRVRGHNEPHILDLVLTDDEIIDNIEYLSPLGKSDHALLSLTCNFDISCKTLGLQYNYGKGDYENLCKFMDIDWEPQLRQCCNVDAMWLILKNRLAEGIQKFVPKISTFYDWHKPSWKCPLPKDVREKIRYKHRLWNRFIETRDIQYLNKYKKIRNNIRRITRQKQKSEQNQIAKATKTNPKKFWAYVKNKTVLKSSIGDLKTIDNGKQVTITDDMEKASAFCEYCSSVFTKAEVFHEQHIYQAAAITKPNIEFHEEKILKMLEKLNVSKSPGPDGLHPRILYETRTKITTPLKLIYEASFATKELPHDWINANISAIFKKGKKSELCNYRPISLTSILCKIMEQFIRDHIIEYFQDNDLFSKNQFGFLKGRSTHALHEV